MPGNALRRGLPPAPMKNDVLCTIDLWLCWIARSKLTGIVRMLSGVTTPWTTLEPARLRLSIFGGGTANISSVLLKDLISDLLLPAPIPNFHLERPILSRATGLAHTRRSEI